MSQNLSGKVAVVTGASKGIGAGIAGRLAAAGAAVVVNYGSDREGAERVVADIVAGGGRAVAVGANVSDPGGVERLFAESVRAFGPIDILVNNAGVVDAAPLGAITPAHFRRLFEVNVLGVILVTQEAIKHFRPEGGSIVNTSSDVSTIAPPGMAVYSASKSAVDSLTRTFSKELGPRNIRVNAVNPGPTETEGAHARGSIELLREVGRQRSLQRIGRPDDIAPLVVFLASDDASWITGESYYVTGGLG
ncbi:MAG: glucose 1-dehydrogenase [Rhodocyclaceae bacterium]|nr:glucose 1-dehydrogenase [Rhodocyclaceae bacterium]